jgi:hypothetical protein
MSVIAEGIETIEQHRTVEALLLTSTDGATPRRPEASPHRVALGR